MYSAVKRHKTQVSDTIKKENILQRPKEPNQYQLQHMVYKQSLVQYLSVVSAFQDVPVVVQLVCHRRAVDLHTGCENHQLIPLAHLCTHTDHKWYNYAANNQSSISHKGSLSKTNSFMTSSSERLQYNVEWWNKWQEGHEHVHNMLYSFTLTNTLTTSKKKSTCGLLCTKNLTGCLSMTTCRKKEEPRSLTQKTCQGVKSKCMSLLVLWGWSLAACQVSLWVWGPHHGESGSASHPGPEPESSSLLHLEVIR